MIAYLDTLDTQLFLWINHHHSPWADWLLWSVSQTWSWAVVLIAVFCLLTLRREPRQWWVVGLGIILCFLLSDRISVLCFKDVVCRLRPCHVLEDVRMFRTHCGGQYGFISSHAANVFSLTMFFALRYGKNGVRSISRRPAPSWVAPVLLFLWACLVAYSRPYLGKHYPGDCVCGAIVGMAMGALVFFLLERIPWTRSHRSSSL
ncbi:MAG: phosphatase PAP2 family protein [Bacteroidales bacterium]|nr:phosphatase PAP2 family protein [Bacteroidales bacterium]